MSTTEEALENLRIIRSLMEKAPVYRAISAPAALVGGLLAVAASAWPVQHALTRQGEALMSATAFLWLWLGLLAVTSTLNLLLLSSGARRRGQTLFSKGMRLALRSLVPPMLVGGVLGIALIWFLHNLAFAALLWVLCYGLALLATADFSPRSLVRLGWSFIAAGLTLFLFWASNSDVRLLANDEPVASAIMGLTFGLLHVIYALCVYFSRQPMEAGAE